MGFTSIANVAALYPTFKRGIPQQQPPDTFIQQFIDDIASVIVSILERRFQQAITAISTTSINPWLTSIGLPNWTWYPGQPVTLGTTVLDSNMPLGVQVCTAAGTTGAGPAPPSFNPVYGEVTDDGSVVWTNGGQTRQFQVLERGNRYGAAAQLGAILASFGVAAAAKIAEEYRKADWAPFAAELNSETLTGKPKASGIYDVLFDGQASIQTPRPLLSGVAGADQPYGIAPAQEGISSLFGKFGVDFGRVSGGGPPWGNGGGWVQ